MKRGFSFCLALCLMLALTACGVDKSSADDSTAETILSGASGSEGVPLPPPPSPDASTPAKGTAPPPDETPEPFPPSPPPAEEPAAGGIPESLDGIDIDLAQMGRMMAFAELSNIVYNANEYVGKVIRVTGTALAYYDEQAGTTCYAVVIQDATACCASGFDLLLEDGQVPPENGQEITVVGVLEMYEITGGVLFPRLKGARIEA